MTEGDINHKKGTPLQSFDYSGNSFREEVVAIMRRKKQLQKERKIQKLTRRQEEKQRSERRAKINNNEGSMINQPSNASIGSIAITELSEDSDLEEQKGNKMLEMESLVVLSLQKLINIVFFQPKLTDLSLNSCLIGDEGFKILIYSVIKKSQSELVSLNLKNNKLTNESIRFITDEYFKQEKDIAILSLSSLMAKPQLKSTRYLRLKSLNLS